MPEWFEKPKGHLWVSREKLQAFADLLEKEYVEFLIKQYPSYPENSIPVVRIKPGKRWVRVNINGSGKYMVDRDGTIYGIKGYGVPHFGHRFGTLDTIKFWNWSGYRAVKKCR